MTKYILFILTMLSLSTIIYAEGETATTTESNCCPCERKAQQPAGGTDTKTPSQGETVQEGG